MWTVRGDRAGRAADWVAGNWSLDLTLAEWWERLFDAGLAFPTWPDGLGGFAASAAEAAAVSAALGAAGAIGPPAGTGPNIGGPTLIEHADPDQLQRFVTPMAQGRTQWCQLFSEPGAGSDLAGIATRAERDGDEFVVTGHKVWSSKADSSEWGMLVARTDPEQPKHRGITFMMIDMRQPGVEARPVVQMNGAAAFCEVFLNEARAKHADVIGGIDDGWNVARATLANERISAAARRGRGTVSVAAGSIEGNLDKPVGELIELAERAAHDPTKRFEALLDSRTMIALARKFGAAEERALRDRLVSYYIDSEVHRLNVRRARDLAKLGRPAPTGPMLKLSLAMLAHKSRDLSLSILGAEGMLLGESAADHGRVQRAGLSAFAPSFGGGTNEIQRNIIGEQTLGLPREPGNNNDIPFKDVRRA